ncbi:MAG: hypothetical protein SOU51_06675 [Collinsella sp.]|nr:hypothetical protein [Collinsella sp.]
MDARTLGFILLGITIASTVFIEFKKRSTYARFERMFANQDFEGCIELLDRSLTRAMYPEYNRLFMRLNASMALGRIEESTSTIDEMASLRMNKDQRLALYTKALAFFVENGDKARALKMLEGIESIGDEGLARASRESFEVFMEKTTKHIDRMERELQDATGAERLRLYQLLAIQYENKGDLKESERYLDLAREAIDSLGK